MACIHPHATHAYCQHVLVQLFLHHVNEEYTGELKAGGKASGGGAVTEKLIDGREFSQFTSDGKYGHE